MTNETTTRCPVCESVDFACGNDHPLEHASAFLQRVHTLEESRLALAICACADRIEPGDDGTLLIQRASVTVAVRAQVSSGSAVSEMLAAYDRTAPGFRLDFLFAAEVDREQFSSASAWFSRWIYDDWGTLKWFENSSVYLPFLAVEVDDPGHWRDPVKAAADRSRDRLLLSMGIATVRVSNDEVRRDPGAVAEEVMGIVCESGGLHRAAYEAQYDAYKFGLQKGKASPAEDGGGRPPESSLQ